MTVQQRAASTAVSGAANSRTRSGGCPPTAPQPTAHDVQRGTAPLSSEAKRRVRFAENQRKGFESAWNEYFDCYASTTYVEEPLIRLEDVSYHLYLKKHINPNNPHWELPSFRQLKRILGLSQDKLQGIEARLATAHLLVKDSGKGKGSKGENVANDYLIYEPRELPEFLLAVQSGELPGTLNEKGQRKLAEFRARFCTSVGSGQWAVGSDQTIGIAPPDGQNRPTETLPTAHCPLPTIGVPIFGTGAVAPVGEPQSGTAGVPDCGSPGLPHFGTGPAPDSGTQNTRRLTHVIQQTIQQQTARPALAPPIGETRRDGVVVVGSDETLRRGDATTLATVQPSQPARLATTDDVPNRVPAAAGESATVDALVERGITSLVAHRLRQSCPAERIARQVAIFDVLREQDPDDPRLTPGRLRRQIEEDWAVPTGFDAKTFAAGADRPEVTAAAPQAEAPHTVAGTATVGRLTAAAAARRDELAAVGLGEDDQALWARVVQAAPVLPPLFRGALFHAPQGDDPAVVIFPSRADYDRALSPLHTATRARIAARLAAMTPAAPGRDGATTTVRYLVYADLLGMIRGE